jgi:hypothetical protein
MRRLGSFLALLVLALGMAAPAGALPLVRDDGSVLVPPLISTSATWTKSTNGSAIVWDAVAFAGSTCRLVQLGGTDGYVRPTATNLFDPKTGTWTAIPAPRRGSWPSYRTLARMTWDPIRQRVILFGGRDGSGNALRDTWAFDPVAKTWTSLTPTCRKGQTCPPAPPARYGHGMAWSSALGKVVVFGGEQRDNIFLNDTWTFDGTAWQQLAAKAAPSARALLGMAEDAATGKILVYGGFTAYPAGSGISLEPVRDTQTWILDPKAATWTAVQTATIPEMRSEMGMAYVATLGAVVMSTGGTVEGCMSWTNSTWAYDVVAKDWRRVTTSTPLPTARNAANLTANLCDGSAILTGGTHDNQLPITLQDRTWILR